MNELNVKNTFYKALELVGRNYPILLGVFIATYSLPIILSILLQNKTKSMLAGLAPEILLSSALLIIPFAWLCFSMFRILINIVDGVDVKLMDIITVKEGDAVKFVKFLIASLIITSVLFIIPLLVFIPFFLLNGWFALIAIPIYLFYFITFGVYFILKYSYATYMLVSKDMSIADAFRKSSDITSGKKTILYKLFLACMALNFIPNTLLDPKEYFSSAAIALIITSVCISGFVTLVNVVAYRTLEKSLEEKTQSEII